MTTRPHVLVAEDEFLAAMAIEDLLSSLGYRTSVAADGSKALALFERDRADAVITDIKMPRMDGLELVGRLRALDPSLPIIVMSGHVFDAPGGPIPENECTSFMRKPLDLDALARRLAALAPCPDAAGSAEP